MQALSRRGAADWAWHPAGVYGHVVRDALSACFDVRCRPTSAPTRRKRPPYSKPVVTATETIQPDWWKQFHDPYLDSLVNKAIDGNFDIKVLAARIQVAGAQIGEARAGALPTMDLGAGASFEKTTGQNFSKQFNLGDAGELGHRHLGRGREGRAGAEGRVPRDRERTGARAT